MEAEDYKTLLKQAEDELGATPGAYCSRKVAVRAMELLRAAGELEFDEADKKWAEVGRQAVDGLKTCRDTIERQAQAIRRLEEEETRGGLGQARNPQNPYPGDGILKHMERMANKSYFDNSGALTQQVFRETLNRKLDQGKPWTEY